MQLPLFLRLLPTVPVIVRVLPHFLAFHANEFAGLRTIDLHGRNGIARASLHELRYIQPLNASSPVDGTISR